MNTLQMQCFLSIAENRSFSRTARELYVSQPTLTKHIQHLENELQFYSLTAPNIPLNLPVTENYTIRHFLTFSES